MAKKEIIWSDRAEKELNTVLKFYFKRNGNPNYSLSLLKEVEDLMVTLSKEQFIGRLTSNKITRVIPIKYFLIFYEIEKKEIHIVSFWDNRQDEEKRIVR